MQSTRGMQARLLSQADYTALQHGMKAQQMVACLMGWVVNKATLMTNMIQ